MPAAPRADLVGPLTQTVNTLGSGGSFSGKSAYIQGLGRFTGKGVELKYNDAVAKGYLPLTATVSDVVPSQRRPATANVTATLASGEVRSMPLTFVQGPSPTGWQLSKPVTVRPRRVGGLSSSTWCDSPYRIPERRHRTGGGVRALRVQQRRAPGRRAVRCDDGDDARRGARRLRRFLRRRR